MHTNRVIRSIPGLSQVHGVFVVPDRHRVYATATGANQMVILDEDTGRELGRGTTGDHPDGLAFDPTAGRLYVAAESGWLTILTE